MTRWSRLAAIAAGVVVVLATKAAAADCPAAPGRETARITGEVAGAQALRTAFGPGWSLQLQPAAFGWRLAVLDAAGLDLSQMTPPLHGPNPRELYGWHFRNAANTGPNEGDVNAPQRLRVFGFDPRLSGTGGWKAAPGMDGVADQPGTGTLHIGDYELADLDSGSRARMVRLAFRVCLSWPSEYGASVAEAAPGVVERMRRCGLGAQLEPGAWLSPASLGGDFDGDGAPDLAVPVTRKKDGKRAIAICRAGTRLDVLGLAGGIGVHLVAAYFDHIDRWELVARGPVGVGAEGGTPPTLRGDAISIGKDDSSSAMIYRRGDAWTSYWAGD